MAIKKKISLILITLMVTILICSYTIIYILFQNTMVSEVINYQESIVSLNKNLITSFMDSIEQTSLKLISDQAMGTYLSNTSNDPLTKFQTYSMILKNFSQYSTSQIPNSLNYFYKSTLFLNDKIPIASEFASKTLDTNSFHKSYNVFSNKAIKNEEWYLNTLKSLRNHYVFINEPSNEFCFAKKIKSTFYVGPYDPDGIGVMVVSIKLDQLENLLTFSPLTPNSSYCLLTKEKEILFKSNPSISSNIFLDLYTTTNSKSYTEDRSMITQIINGEKYVINKSSLDWNLSILFITPYLDITTQVASFMNPFLLFAVFVILLVPFLAYYIAGKITKPIITLSTAIESISDTRTFELGALDFSKDKEIVILCNRFKNLILTVNGLIKDVEIQGEKQKQSELQALQAQINPHFIFNAMDVVNWIALSRNQDDIATIVASISNLMRYSITNPNHQIRISDEIENIYEFISIHQLRHEYPIILKVHSMTSLDIFFVPKFIIQPLIENTIKHGINYASLEEKLEINLSIYLEENYLFIEVSSTGISCNPQILNDFLHYIPTTLTPSNGFGIRNVNERIKLHFQENSGLSYYLNAEGQLTAKICIKYS